MTKRILIICRKPPYGSSLGREALDIALASSVFDQSLSILFTGEGVWQLHKGQQGQQVDQKGYDNLLSAFPLYEINDLYVDTESIEQRQLMADDLVVDAQTLSSDEIKQLMAEHDVLLNF